MDLDFEKIINILPKELIDKLQNSIQNLIFHSEGNVYNHTKLVYDNILNDSSIEIERKYDLLICAIFHDLGKINTLKIYEKSSGKIAIQNIGHELFAEFYIDSYKYLFSEEFKIKYNYILNWEKIKFICKEHMRAHKLVNGEIKKETKIKYFTENKYYKDLLRFVEADDKGRIINMKNQSQVIITLGIPGSGKTTWRKNFISKNPDWKVICPDDLRKEVTGNISDISQDTKVWRIAVSLLEEYLSNKKDVIFDSTACNIVTQKRLENIAKKYNTIILYKIFEVSSDIAKERIKKDLDFNVDRSKVPDAIIDKMTENFILAKGRVLLSSKQTSGIFILN